MRSFVALELPDAVRGEIVALQAALRPGRKVPEENLHLTLAFLDDQPEPVLQALHDHLSQWQAAPFDLCLTGLDMFGGKRPRLLYLSVAANPALIAVHRHVRQIAREVGIDLPRERFRPHVTLARFGRDLHEEQMAQIGRFMARYGSVTMPPFEVSQVHLFGSTLHPEGAVHEVLATYPLRT
ncbi:RNA 2',3'-cyclic phosphodiesterase [Shimia sediminis]|uniref:RNA 2',3'-cyclic phosphodiesterase n=1 Tax=Shimia sediminis TaxID=2497945 RepID=UPI000F8E5CF9|nr:RNA 2',3'-cyclic phosphodiesterase [Shimia sediminis]